MSLLIYLPRKFDQTHEREQYRNICKLLKSRYMGKEDEMCLFVANYNIGDVEPDGFLIKNDGLSLVEFKDYGGVINVTENGDWKGVREDGGTFVVKGGAGRKNPYAQARINRNAFKSAIVEIGALNTEQAKNISGMVLFHQPCTFNNEVSPGIRWFKVADENSFIDCFDDIVTPNLDLEEKDFYKLIDRLALDRDWLEVRYSDVSVLERKSEYDENPGMLFPEMEEEDGGTTDSEPEIVLTIPTENPEPTKPGEDMKSGSTPTLVPSSGEEQFLRDVRLPDWVDSLLFDKLRARYDPDWQRFAENLDLSDDDQKRYLGTYFPRSYAEQYCIIKNMMLNKRFKAPYDKLDTVAILDLCSGCGGDLVGAIVAVVESCPKLKSLLITVVEACETSITSLSTVIAECRKQFPSITIECKCARCKISSFEDIKNLDILEFAPYDIILFNKAGGELIRQGMTDAYYKACETLVPMLNNTGIFCVLDVTTKDPAENQFYPQIMNRQITQFIIDTNKYRTILPLSCRFYEHTCKKPCFTQQNFFVSHRYKMKDFSKVAYRIIGHRLFIMDATVGLSPNGKAYQVNDNAQEYTGCSTGQQIINAYKMNE